MKSIVKKMFCLALVLVICVCSVISVCAQSGYVTNKLNNELGQEHCEKASIQGIVNYNLDTDGRKMLENIESCYLQFQKVLIKKDNTINFSGMINNIDFDFYGNLNKSYIDENNIVGDLTDSTGNFDILFFGFEKNLVCNLLIKILKKILLNCM